MRNIFLYFYERVLAKAVLQSSVLPNHVLLIIDETDLLYDSKSREEAEKLRRFVKWCHALKIDIISVYVSIIRDDIDRKLLDKIYKKLFHCIFKTFSKEKAYIKVYTAGGAKLIKSEREKRRINISIGLGGKSELTKAMRNIAWRIKKGEIEPEEINDGIIESELIFKSEPDLIIRTGATRLTDFLIWQSVYSEFYFTDVNWANFRKIDLIRAVRDFQLRERRFGR